MEITVRYFAAIRERLGLREERLEVSGVETLGIDGLWTVLTERHPELAPLREVIRLGVNLDFAEVNTIVHDGDEVALIPPVSGGLDEPERLSSEPLSLDAVIARVTRPEAGAIATFTGAVRDHSQGHAVTTLEYEVYPRMAIHKLREIEHDIEARFPAVRCAVCHRHGELGIGDLAVVIAVSSPHRREAFEACALTIEWIKARVPIWKKETGPDGSVWVGMGS